MEFRIGLVLIMLLLAGCASQAIRLGMSEKQWQSYSKPEQQKILVQAKKTNALSKKADKVYAGPEIMVYLDNGSVMRPPFTEAFTFMATQFQLEPGQCKTIRLYSLDTDENADVRSCYNGLTLSLDPSRYDPEGAKGTVHLDYNPIWKRGFTYSGISSEGYAHLMNANVTVKALPTKLRADHGNQSDRS